MENQPNLSRTAFIVDGDPAIIMTARGDAGLKRRAEGLDVIGFIEKPFRPERLEDILLGHFEEAERHVPF